MKMFDPKSLSAIAFYLFRMISILILLLVIYIDFAFITNNFAHSNGRYRMDIPLTGTFINGDYQFNTILTISLGLFFGVFFFYVLSNVFKALKGKIIFNKNIIYNLKLFTILNLIVGPVLYTLIHFPIMNKTDFRDLHNLILHLIFGMIALFLTHIFQNGYKVQLENDLTI
ncbi:DUF2975 domain-containing protein [Maribacter sp. ACAM166]|uniref:DUF2975 domain-containing protein n=1 Tax=Maribacter sp. ACAM166 TaxID=2508996 RepID=UPI0010FEE6C7|nr:DUF2975 domain-containing protein [Maribacter sp. ACAM166]TLP72906.1 DUF2975 domain-containing protein [Maribacter sp. ACAM166]